MARGYLRDLRNSPTSTAPGGGKGRLTSRGHLGPWQRSLGSLFGVPLLPEWIWVHFGSKKGLKKLASGQS